VEESDDTVCTINTTSCTTTNTILKVQYLL
jgi:hypothetical protein